MVVVGWRLFSLSVAAALLGAETALAQNAALAQMSTPCVNDAPDPYRRGASFAPLPSHRGVRPRRWLSR
jgi:hypothetical protein